MKDMKQSIAILDAVDAQYQTDCKEKEPGFLGKRRYKTFSENLARLRQGNENMEPLMAIMELCDDMRTSRLRNRLVNACWDILELQLPAKTKSVAVDAEAVAAFAKKQYPVASTMFPAIATPARYAEKIEAKEDVYSSESFKREDMIRLQVKMLRASLVSKRDSYARLA